MMNSLCLKNDDIYGGDQSIPNLAMTSRSKTCVDLTTLDFAAGEEGEEEGDEGDEEGEEEEEEVAMHEKAVGKADFSLPPSAPPSPPSGNGVQDDDAAMHEKAYAYDAGKALRLSPHMRLGPDDEFWEPTTIAAKAAAYDASQQAQQYTDAEWTHLEAAAATYDAGGGCAGMAPVLCAQNIELAKSLSKRGMCYESSKLIAELRRRKAPAT